MENGPNVVPILMDLMVENRQLAQRSEDRRIVLTSVTILAATASLIALSMGFPPLYALLLASWLIVLGLTSALACLKLYERSQFHEKRARRLRSHVASLLADGHIEQLLADVDKDHTRTRPRLSSLRFNSLLVAINIVVAVLGLVYLILSLVHLL